LTRTSPEGEDQVGRLALPSLRLPLVVSFYALVAAVCTLPLVLHLADALAPAPDTLLQSWILAWDIHALTTDPLHLYDANIYFPFPLSLAYSDAMLSGALMVAPVLLLTGNPVLAHNILTLVSLVVAATGMFLLVGALTGDDFAGLVAGCIFGFCASRQAQFEHIHLLQFGWLPLALLYLHKAVERGRASDFLLFVLFTVCQILASVYLAWMMAIAYAIFIVVELASRRSSWKRDNIVRLAGALLLAGVVVTPVMWPYALAQQLYDFHWPMDVIGDLSAVPTDYLSVPAQNLLYAPVLGQFWNARYPSEHILFPGLVALVMAVIAIARRRLDVEVVRYSLMASVAFVLSFGPFLHLNDRDEGIPLPYLYLLQVVPAFGVMRVPARFDLLVMLALSVVAGFGVARLSTVLARRTSALNRRLLLGAVVVVTLFEVLPQPRSMTPISVGAAVPPVYSWLRHQDPTAVVAEIPTRGPTGYATFGYEYMSTYHWHPLVNGSSGFEPPASTRIANELDAFPDPAAVRNLRSLGVRYVVAHVDDLDDRESQRLTNANLAQLQLGIAATFGQDVVYEFAPLANRPLLQDHLQLELPSLVGRGRSPSATVTITNDTPDPLYVAAPQAVGAQIEWNHNGTTESARQDLPVFIEPNHSVSLLVSLPVPSTLTAADSAQLRVRLTGAVKAEASQTVHFADLPTSLDRSQLSATLERVQLPTLVQTSTPVAIEVTMRNSGRAIWLPDPPGASGTKGVVGVSVRSWIDSDGRLVPASEASTAHVQWNVNPGQAATVTLQTKAPSVPGHYDLVLDMLSENVTWFDDVNGGARTIVPVDVEP